MDQPGATAGFLQLSVKPTTRPFSCTVTQNTNQLKEKGTVWGTSVTKDRDLALNETCLQL